MEKSTQPSSAASCSRHQQRLTTTGKRKYVAASPLESITALFSSPSSSEPANAIPPSTAPASYLPDWWVLHDPLAVGLLSALSATGLTIGTIAGYRRYWRRIRNSNSVTTGILDRKTWIRGVVTSVGDGDNLRLYHTPGPFFRYPFKIRRIPNTAKELKDETIHIRIAGVDAPENAHFGQPAQPHAKESLNWLRATVLGKRMRCELLAKDQYNRIVAVPYISRTLWWDTPLPLLMLKNGMAVVYEAGGAEYGPWGLEKMKSIEADAKIAKKGLWGVKGFEHPSEYKARMKAGETQALSLSGNGKTGKKSGGLLGFLKRLLGSQR